MKVGVVGVGRVGAACALSLVARGVPIAEALPAGSSFDDFRKGVERDVRYANITIIEGNAASQFGIASARIAEAVLRDERAMLPIGAYNANYGITLSLPSVVKREGVSRILEPAISDEERRGLDQSAEVLRQAVQRTS
jgi:L-lactate dehydrogenase